MAAIPQLRMAGRSAVTLVALLVLLVGCTSHQDGLAQLLPDRDREAAAGLVPGGDIDRGRQLIHGYGCVACHTVPGVAAAHGRVGPTLAGFADREYFAGGFVSNTPEQVVLWIQDPMALKAGDGPEPLTLMPPMGVSPQDATDIAAYLYTLREAR